MLQQVLALVLPVLGWWLLTGIINLAFAYKSQIEAWAESNPRLAALLKLTRALGFDPWNLLSSLKLLASKKLPDAQKADSAVSKMEQRKADLKKLDFDDPVVIIPPSSRPPSALLVLLVSGLALAQARCARMADPCGEVSFATVQAGCEVRVEQECAAGNKKCPAYVECSRAITRFRSCP